jgi:hypothetical protein
MGDILRASGADLVVDQDEPAAFGGLFRFVRLRKPRPPP